LETFNLYMDELSSDLNGDAERFVEVQFRIVPASTDEGDPETDAVLAGLDIFDLIDLRDEIQGVIDALATSGLEATEVDGAES
jgi:polyisoprenoid-binding protein YceI